ncbi:MAG TPA: hypothetical protein VFD47_04615 [Actinomycetota bacterium]|nr:hypothetical protein [Actinomycetota bacterium]
MSDLERSLTAMGSRIEWPEGGDLTGSVRATIEGSPPRRATPWRTLAYAAAFVGLLSIVSLLSFPGVRTAVADFLGIGGVRIDTEGTAPTPAAELDLGERVSLGQARDLVSFEVRLPDALGRPDSVWLDTGVTGGQVALAYESSPGLPAAPGTNLGALVTQFPDAEVAATALKKVTGSRAGTTFEPVVVEGEQGFWVSGEPHVIAYLEPDGSVRNETVRLAGNVLLWESDGVTYRIESTLSQAEALAIAESLD